LRKVDKSFLQWQPEPLQAAPQPAAAAGAASAAAGAAAAVALAPPLKSVAYQPEPLS